MNIDTELIIEIAKLAAAGLITLFVSRFLERRPKLVFYRGHIASHRVKSEEPFSMGTHTIVIRNAGRYPAKNVRISHQFLPPNIDIYPKIQYRREPVPDSADDIVFPNLAPKQQVTISYLYHIPPTYNQIDSGVSSDEGLAKFVDVVLIPRLKAWQQFFYLSFVFTGILTILYFAVTLIQNLFGYVA